LIDGINEEQSSEVRMELLSSTVKLFFKRPPEISGMLGRLLKQSLADTSRIDVRDRALMYYRLLRLDVHEAARVVHCPKVIVDKFAETDNKEVKEQIFSEFNSFSVVYNMPSEKFTRLTLTFEEEEEKVVFDEEEEGKKAPEKLYSAPAEGAAAPAPASGGGGATAGGAVEPEDILDFDKPPEEESAPAPAAAGPLGAVAASAPASAPAPAPAPSGPPRLELTPNATLDAKLFQMAWTKLPGKEFSFILATPATAKAIDQLVGKARIYTMASGAVGHTMKFYLFAIDIQTKVFLFEVLGDLTSGALKVTIKTDAPEKIPSMMQIFHESLQAVLRP